MELLLIGGAIALMGVLTKKKIAPVPEGEGEWKALGGRASGIIQKTQTPVPFPKTGVSLPSGYKAGIESDVNTICTSVKDILSPTKTFEPVMYEVTKTGEAGAKIGGATKYIQVR